MSKPEQVTPIQHAYETLKHDDNTLGSKFDFENLLPDEQQAVWEDAGKIISAIETAQDSEVQYLSES